MDEIWDAPQESSEKSWKATYSVPRRALAHMSGYLLSGADISTPELWRQGDTLVAEMIPAEDLLSCLQFVEKLCG